MDFAALRVGIKSLVWQKAHFGAPVVNVDTEAIDRQIRRSVRSLVGLPKGFPPVALHWLLRLWPSQYQVDWLKLKMAWKCRHQLWLQPVVAAAVAASVRRVAPALARGPFGSFTEALGRYGLGWADLEDPQYEGPGGYKKWVGDTHARIVEAWCERVARSREELPRTSLLRRHLPSTAEEGVKEHLKVPPFLLCGDLGRAGLRLLAPTMGHTEDPKECGLCHQSRGTSLPAHLAVCPGVPESLGAARDVVLAQCYAEAVGGPTRRLGPDRRPMHLDCVSRMQWEGMSFASLRELLWVYARIFDYYCKHGSAGSGERAALRPIRASSYSRYVGRGRKDQPGGRQPPLNRPA